MRSVKNSLGGGSPSLGWVVEIAGVAGSGKTSLTRTLCADRQFVGMAIPSSMQCLRQLPKVATQLLPAQLWTIDHRFSWEEIRSMIYVEAWLRAINHKAQNQVQLLDQGSVFRLAMLREFWPRTARWQEWWWRLLDAWSHRLTLVVWLDAPNETLLSRIRDRPKNHRCKALPPRAAQALLDRHRNAHELVLDEMQRRGGTRVIRFTGGDQSVHQIAQLLTEAIRLPGAAQ